MIHNLDESIETGKVTEAKLKQYQVILNEIDDSYRYDIKYDDDRYKLLELQAIIHYLQKNYELAEQFASEARENKGPKKRFISQTIHEISERSRNAEVAADDPVPEATSGANDSYPENYAVGAGTVYDNSYKNHVDSLKNSYNKELPVFYHTSPWQAALLDFFTLGLYSIYWFYKHWRMIQISTGEKLSPFLRAIFQIFFVFSLFKRIHNTAQIAHYSGFNSHAAFATIL